MTDVDFFTPTDDPLADKFRPSLVTRAKKRHVVTASDGWRVMGQPNLGDSREWYGVRYDPTVRRYHCVCYTSDYGQVRKAKVCSHVLAVIFHRRSVGSASSPPGEKEQVAPPCVPADPTIPPPSDGYWTRYGDKPIPAKFEQFGDHQTVAYERIMDAFTRADVVMVDAPTGSGKTLIAEMVRRGLGKRALYVCSNKSLQEQFAADFDYCRVLKGRSNYPTQLAPFPDITCADCTSTGKDDPCTWCGNRNECVYRVAKNRALTGRLTVLNTSYLLAEANHVGDMSGRGLVIVDECDVMEKELMGFVQFELTGYRLKSLNLTAPKKGSHKPTIASWMELDLLPAVESQLRTLPARSDDVKVIRKRAGLQTLKADIQRIAPQLRGPGADNWIRDNNAGPLVLKPIRVNEDGKEVLWKHGQKWLLMSATIVSPGQLADDLGIEDAGLKWEYVKVPMTFPVENRRIVVRNVADMANKHKETAWPAMADGIRLILADHPDERVLVHAVSYQLSGYLRDRLADLDRPVLTYRNAQERDATVAEYRRRESAVLVAPSLDRGVDFRDEDCRVVVVAKVPFPYLGDEQVSARLHAKGGNGWYACNAVRTLVQMTGRGVRNKDDWAKSYILDGQFLSNVWKRNRQLLPGWWKEAVTIER